MGLTGRMNASGLAGEPVAKGHSRSDQGFPLAALVCARLFGPSARAPVRIAALAYAGFVAIVFVQALRGLPLIPF